jgi:hypothetical protein
LVEKQIREAQERGEFDNLPGAGKPLRGIDADRDDPDWWVGGRWVGGCGITHGQVRPAAGA